MYLQAKGHPVPTARWLKNGREISMGGRFTSSTVNGVFKLTITDLCEVDNGDIVCEAINSIGFATTSARLKIGSTLVYLYSRKSSNL